MGRCFQVKSPHGYGYPPFLRHSGVSVADKRRAITPFMMSYFEHWRPRALSLSIPFRSLTFEFDVVSKLSDIFSLLLWFDVKPLEKVCLSGVKGWATTLRSLFTGLRDIQSKSLKDLRIHASPPISFDDRFPYDALEVALASTGPSFRPSTCTHPSPVTLRLKLPTKLTNTKELSICSTDLGLSSQTVDYPSPSGCSLAIRLTASNGRVILRPRPVEDSQIPSRLSDWAFQRAERA